MQVKDRDAGRNVVVPGRATIVVDSRSVQGKRLPLGAAQLGEYGFAEFMRVELSFDRARVIAESHGVVPSGLYDGSCRSPQTCLPVYSWRRLRYLSAPPTSAPRL